MSSLATSALTTASSVAWTTGERPRLGDPGDPGHLAVAVLAVEAGRYRVGGAGPAAGMDAGDAGPHPVALDQRDVPDLYSGHVGDGVPGPGAARERDLQPAGPRPAGRRLAVPGWSGDQGNPGWRTVRARP